MPEGSQLTPQLMNTPCPASEAGPRMHHPPLTLRLALHRPPTHTPSPPTPFQAERVQTQRHPATDLIQLRVCICSKQSVICKPITCVQVNVLRFLKARYSLSSVKQAPGISSVRVIHPVTSDITENTWTATSTWVLVCPAFSGSAGDPRPCSLSRCCLQNH